MKNKLLIIYRLYDRSYGESGNPKTLAVNLNEDSTLSYSFYGGWQDSGMGFAISNLQLQESLPMGSRNFKNVKKLDEKIQSVLMTGVGSHNIKTREILNEIKD
jgi:hypothetical protein